MEESLVKPFKRNDFAKTAIIAPSSKIFRIFKEQIVGLKTKKPIADSILVETSDDFSLIGPVLGSPAMAIVMEQLAASGVEKVFFLGLCGGLITTNPNIKVADIVFPRGAISEEGTTALYGGNSEFEFDRIDLQLSFEKNLNLDLETHEGLIWTTDAPYRESFKKVEEYSERGAIAVEMEFSCILHLSKLFKIELVSAFVVSDLLSTRWEAGFSKPEVEKSLSLLANSFCKVNCE